MSSLFSSLKRLAPVGRLDGFRAAVGSLLGIFLSGFVGFLWLGTADGLPFILAPMGASAVLLFAVPASPLAQPWSVIGGNGISALVGVACLKLVPDPLLAAPLAVALAIGAMSLARCLHPPGGAMALTAVIGGPAIADAGFSFVLVPVAINSMVLLAAAWLFNNATHHRYPHRIVPPVSLPHGTSDPLPQDRVGFTTADLDAVLAQYDELLDVSLEDLEALFRQVEARAHRRLHRNVSCADIMSRDMITATPGEGVGQARDRMLERGLSAMPVVDDAGMALGLVTHAQLLAGQGRHVGDVMRRDVCSVAPDQPIDELLPALSGGLHHDALILDPAGQLVGFITQTDLLAALWRSHVAEQVASVRE